MPIFSAMNGYELKLLIYFQERKIREKLLPNEGMNYEGVEIFEGMLDEGTP